jgi:Saccharopine dehydrogenase NADP binding domain
MSNCRRRSGSVGVMSAAQREFDIVLYGATGFAGKLTAEYLARAAGDARIALAGRSQDKLRAVRESLPDKAQSWPLIAADASQPSTLDALAARTQVVVTTVGPYTRYGLPLVAACAATGTDYADLTGEASITSRPPTPARASCIRADSIRSLQISPYTRCIGACRRTRLVSSPTPTWWCARWRAAYPAAPSQR